MKEAGAVADDAELRKTKKYSNLTSSHYFVPLAVESLGVFGKEACPARSGVIGGVWEGGLSRSQWSHWGCLGRRLVPLAVESLGVFGKEACPARSGVIGGVWEGGLSRSQWSHWGCLGRRLVPLAVESLGVFGKEACPARSGVIGGVWEGGLVLFEGVRATRKNVIRQPHGTTSSGSPNLSGCTKRECCCSAGEHWTEGRGLVVFWWWCYSGGFCCCCVLFYYYYISVNIIMLMRKEKRKKEEKNFNF